MNIASRKWLPLSLVAIALPTLAQAELMFGLQGSERIVTFDSASPMATLSNRAITGLGVGEVLVGLDLRPMNDQLYSLSTSGNLYRFSDAGASFTANLIGNIGVDLLGSSFGFDFNPVTDRLRVVTNFDQNLRFNVDNAVTIVDGQINPADLILVGSAYTNSFAGATSTTLYGIDTLTSSLVRSTNPNAGTYVNVGSLGVDPLAESTQMGFDISGMTGIGYLGLNDSLYTVDLITGAANAVGAFGFTNLRGLTVGSRSSVAVPEPASWAMMIVGFAAIGLAMRRRATCS